MNRFIAATLTAGMMIAGVSAVDARDGCGPGGYRGPHGHCRPLRGGPGFGGAGVLVVGQHYPGRGYWDGRRYYQHRDRFHGDYRYR